MPRGWLRRENRWRSAGTMALLPAGLGLCEFLYLWLGRHLSAEGLLAWLHGLLDQFLG